MLLRIRKVARASSPEWSRRAATAAVKQEPAARLRLCALKAQEQADARTDMNLDPWLKAAPNGLALAPMTVLLTLACLVAIVDLFIDDPKKGVAYWLTQASLAIVALLSASYFDNGFTIYAMQRMIVADPMGHLLGLFATLAAMVSLAYARPYAAQRDMLKGELFTLAMFSLLGILVMVSANNFLVVYLGLELMSLSLYALVAMRRDDTGATEAAMKYFVLGALASGFLLYGLSMMYGATGSLEISEVFKAIGIGQINRSVLSLGTVFVVAGSRSSSAPCRSTVGARCTRLAERGHAAAGGAPKLAVSRSRSGCSSRACSTLAVDWQQMLVLLSVASCCSATSLDAQTNLKRMLAYHDRAGRFMLLGLCPASSPATRSRPATATARRCSRDRRADALGTSA